MHLIIRGNALRIPLADQSVHCVVTSPPYWSLRDYQTPGQLGLERSPAEYIARMVEVFREAWRILRDDGTLWVNMGDSFAGGKQGRSDKQDGGGLYNGKQIKSFGILPKQNAVPVGLKPKDLCAIPWRLALALQDDGWWLRRDIIWSKPSPMPESVTDRPTSAHEYVFLLTKSERYFYDGEASKEKALNTGGNGGGKAQRKIGDSRRDPETRTDCPAKEWIGSSRNLRSVWTIASEPFKGSHFATYPRELVSRCVKAGTSERGCCPMCGKPWERVTESIASTNTCATWNGAIHQINKGLNRPGEWYDAYSKTLGFRQACTCPESPPVPCTVFDPFVGSGTTVVVAEALGRHGIGLELSPKYCAMAMRRITRPHARITTPKPTEFHPLFEGLTDGRDTRSEPDHAISVE